MLAAPQWSSSPTVACPHTSVPTCMATGWGALPLHAPSLPISLTSAWTGLQSTTILVISRSGKLRSGGGSR